MDCHDEPEDSFAYKTGGMDEYLQEYLAQEEENFIKAQEAIADGILPPQEIHYEIYQNGQKKASIVLKTLDLTKEQKVKLAQIKHLYPKTKKIIRAKEGLNLCIYSDKKKDAIGYGQNIIWSELRGRTDFRCITKDYAEWLMHFHLKTIITQVQNTDFYKKWGKKVGEDYMANLYSKVYNVGYSAFINSKQYKLMLKNPFTNKDKIESLWIQWENKNRRKEEITAMHNDPVFKKNLKIVKHNQSEKKLDDALRELNII
jgi:hypothetical protein